MLIPIITKNKSPTNNLVHLENIPILLLKYHRDTVAFYQKLISGNIKVNTAVKLFT